MTVELTEEMRQALAAQPEEPLCLVDPKTNERYVVLRSEIYDRFKALLEVDDESLQRAWLDMAAKTRRAWVRENRY